MTELEFEKASRGTSSPAVGEPASGSACSGDANITPATAISNSGAANETASNTSASAVYNNQASVQGPLRSGALATATSTRTTAGAGFYGIMDMSGNVTEQVVTIGNSTGRTFTGAHGNGALNAAGNADISTWPGYVTNAITGATGSGKRGGSWEDISDRLLISDRFQANTSINSRDRNTGFRAARSLPSAPAQ
jgi:formylglycine-generating enzyme required for sulfatase activity